MIQPQMQPQMKRQMEPQTKRQMTQRQAILTVDLEDWYQTNDFNFGADTWGRYESRIEQSTERVLNLLDEYGAKATFFVLGCIAQDHPQMVREIHRRGHELASHGGWHRLLTTMSMNEIKDDLRIAKAAVEDCVGVEVTAFRAPSWSISWQNIEVLRLLQDLGFRIDSSLQPFRTPLSGMKGIPHHPFHPSVNGVHLDLLEVPPTLGKMFGLPVPFSGGLYLRVLPSVLSKHLMKKVVEAEESFGESTGEGTAFAPRPGMLYIHPWELDVHQPRLPVSPLLRFTHYYNLHTTEPKVRALLSMYQWVTLSDGVRGLTFPRVRLGEGTGR